ncbi:carbonic anhydrase [bacterium]|jgi:carbonic anhydrase|nr:carbonic anhydrase [bacterium]
MIASLTMALTIALTSDETKTNTTTQTNAKTVAKLNPYAENAFRRIVEGNARFSQGLKTNPNQDIDKRLEVAKGQVPHTIVLTCADSRLSPEILFDQGLGDLFVIRVAGNVADQFTIASIEYAAEHLHSPLLVVLGHERCGAVAAAVGAYESHLKSDSHTEKPAENHGDEHANITALVKKILPSVLEAARTSGPILDKAININVENTISDVFTHSPLLRRLSEEAKFSVVGGTYDLDDGRVTFTAPRDAKTLVRIH